MNCDRLRVAFAGTPEFAAVALGALQNSDHDVVGVLTQPDRPAGRGRKLTPGAVKKLALSYHLPVLQPESFKDPEAINAVSELKPDVLVVAAYGLILPAALLHAAPLGSLNIHASLLPRWRGAAPIHRAILAGDEQTGVCIMQMDEGLDTGDVLLRKTCGIELTDTTGALHDRLAALGASALMETLPLYCRGQLTPQKQPEQGVSYAHKLTKQEAAVDFASPAGLIDRQIRAMNPWPVASAILDNKRVRIWTCELPELADSVIEQSDAALPGRILSVDQQALTVSTGSGLIRLTRLQWPGGKTLQAGDFARSRNLVGMSFSRIEN